MPSSWETSWHPRYAGYVRPQSAQLSGLRVFYPSNRYPDPLTFVSYLSRDRSGSIFVLSVTMCLSTTRSVTKAPRPHERFNDCLGNGREGAVANEPMSTANTTARTE